MTAGEIHTYHEGRENMHVTEVAAALIWKGQKVLIARRAPGQKHAGGWEFPGGKIEDGETSGAALFRELGEELGIKARIGDLFAESEYTYDSGKVRLIIHHIPSFTGDIQVTVHDRFVFALPKDLMQYDLLPADLPAAELLVKIFPSGDDLPGN